MKLEVGQFVRTNRGIFIISHINIDFDDSDYRKVCLCQNEKVAFTSVHIINKFDFSDNILKLIKLGDYVNGYPVYETIEYPDNTKAIVISDDNKSIIWEENSQYIKSIVTKEQFEQMAYKVGE